MVIASDSTGARIFATGTTTFSSSAPMVADVSRSGLVTAVAPGEAVITASLTLDGVTRTGSMVAVVLAPPTPAWHFATLMISPTQAVLNPVAPGNTIQLSLVASDSGGARVAAPRVAAFSSSDTAIATVSGAGLVTALSPGLAAITASVTTGSVTRTASRIAVVNLAGVAPVYPDLTGVWDLSGLIIGSDPFWGYPGTRQTTVLTIVGSIDEPSLTGTFTDLSSVSPDYGSFNRGPGALTGSLDQFGAVILELSFLSGQRASYFRGMVDLESKQITGTYVDAGHVDGTFTAVRRIVGTSSP